MANDVKWTRGGKKLINKKYDKSKVKKVCTYNFIRIRNKGNAKIHILIHWLTYFLKLVDLQNKGLKV